MDTYAGPYRPIWAPTNASNLFLPLTPAFRAARWGNFIWRLEYTSVTGATGSAGDMQIAPVMGLSYDGRDWPTNLDLTNPQTFTELKNASGWIYAGFPSSAMPSGGVAPRPYVNFGVLVASTKSSGNEVPAFARARIILQDAL